MSIMGPQPPGWVQKKVFIGENCRRRRVTHGHARGPTAQNVDISGVTNVTAGQPHGTVVRDVQARVANATPAHVEASADRSTPLSSETCRQLLQMHQSGNLSPLSFETCRRLSHLTQLGNLSPVLRRSQRRELVTYLALRACLPGPSPQSSGQVAGRLRGTYKQVSKTGHLTAPSQLLPRSRLGR